MSKELSPKYNPAEVEAGRLPKNGLTLMFSSLQAIKRLSLIQSLFRHKRNWETSPWVTLGIRLCRIFIIRQKRMQGF